MSRNTDKINRDLELVARVLGEFTPARVADLVRRGGKPENPSQTAERLGVAKGTHSDPTAAAVLGHLVAKDGRLVEREGAKDSIFEAVKGLAQSIHDMAELARSVEQTMRFILEGPERLKEAQVVHCAACGREVAATKVDRIRSGYCAACYMAWLRDGRPYRFAFEVSRRNSLPNDAPQSDARTMLRRAG